MNIFFMWKPKTTQMRSTSSLALPFPKRAPVVSLLCNLPNLSRTLTYKYMYLQEIWNTISVCAITSTMFYVTYFLYLMIYLRDLCVLIGIELLHTFYQMQSSSSHGCPIVCFMSFSSDGYLACFRIFPIANNAGTQVLPCTGFL